MNSKYQEWCFYYGSCLAGSAFESLLRYDHIHYHFYSFASIKPYTYIYIFIVIALDESNFLDVPHFPMKNIMSRDLEARPIGGATSDHIQ